MKSNEVPIIYPKRNPSKAEWVIIEAYTFGVSLDLSKIEDAKARLTEKPRGIESQRGSLTTKFCIQRHHLGNQAWPSRMLNLSCKTRHILQNKKRVAQEAQQTASDYWIPELKAPTRCESTRMGGSPSLTYQCFVCRRDFDP